MTEVVLAVDQGTSSSRCFVVDAALNILAVASRPVESTFPRPGWVEQDPEQIARSVTDAIAEAEFPTTYAAVEQLKDQYGFEYLRRNVRLCAELGADIVKTNWPGDEELFGRLVEAAGGVPVVLAGGSRLKDRELLWRMERAMAAGGIGCSVGRNIFMHRSPEAITRALSRVIRERWSAGDAFDELQRKAGEEAP